MGTAYLGIRGYKDNNPAPWIWLAGRDWKSRAAVDAEEVAGLGKKRKKPQMGIYGGIKMVEAEGLEPTTH